MSAHPTTRRAITPVRVSASVRSIVLEWGVSRSSLGSLAPEGSSHLITLRYHANPDAPERWSLVDPTRKLERVLDLGHGTSIPEIRISGGCVLVRSSSVYAFISIEKKEPALLYARTGIFGSLGIAGGRAGDFA
jgi:hypothetical protein